MLQWVAMKFQKSRSPKMLIPTIIMAVLALILFTIAYSRGEGQHLKGLKFAISITSSIIPLLFFAMIIAGMIQALLPQELIAKWVGNESGFRGILIGSLAGSITPGGPFVCYPIVAGILRAGAGVGTIVAFVTGWSVLAVFRLPMEVGVVGWRLTFIRLACSFLFPPIAGLIAHFFFHNVKLFT